MQNLKHSHEAGLPQLKQRFGGKRITTVKSSIFGFFSVLCFLLGLFTAAIQSFFEIRNITDVFEPLTPDRLILSDEAFTTPLLVNAGLIWTAWYETNGLYVSALTPFDSANGSVCPAADAGVQVEDIILTVDDLPVKDPDSFAGIAEGRSVTLGIRRDDEMLYIDVYPIYSPTNNRYMIGITYYPEVTGTEFDSLSSISFVAPEQKLMMTTAHISANKAGQIFTDGSAYYVDSGFFVGETEIILPDTADFTYAGSISDNDIFGVTVRLNAVYAYEEEDVVYAAPLSSVKKGKAQICVSLDGKQPQMYDVEIMAIYRGVVHAIEIRSANPEITRFVSGMSGVPLLQNGKLIGAVATSFGGETAFCTSAEAMLSNMLEGS